MEDTDDSTEYRRRIALAVRDACVAAVKEGYERAAISGLCGEGAFEAALGALQMVDVETIARQAGRPLP